MKRPAAKFVLRQFALASPVRVEQSSPTADVAAAVVSVEVVPSLVVVVAGSWVG